MNSFQHKINYMENAIGPVQVVFLARQIYLILGLNSISIVLYAPFEWHSYTQVYQDTTEVNYTFQASKTSPYYCTKMSLLCLLNRKKPAPFLMIPMLFVLRSCESYTTWHEYNSCLSSVYAWYDKKMAFQAFGNLLSLSWASHSTHPP